MTTKKTTPKAPTDANKPRYSRGDSQVAKKPNIPVNAAGELTEASLSWMEQATAKYEKEIAKLKVDLATAKGEATIVRKEVAYYKERWTETEEELADLDNESWWNFTKYRAKRWFSEIFECEAS